MHARAATPVAAVRSSDKSAPRSPSPGAGDGPAAITPMHGLAGSPAPPELATRVGSVDDPAEIEAERSADVVIEILRRQQDDPWVGSVTERVTSQPGGLVRRLSGGGGRERLLRSARVGAQGGLLDPDVDGQIERMRGGGRPLPPMVRRTMESAFGADLSGVRVHTGPQATSLNDRLASRAFTKGDDVVFAAGVPDLAQPSGQRLWAHELAHVLQQRGSTVRVPSTRLPEEAPLRRITSLGAFQRATPAGWLKDRKTILNVDDQLSAYIDSVGAARVAACQALITACTTYVTGDGHDAGRVQAVTNLRAEALAELPLLQALGANADVLELAVERAGGAAQLASLTQLALLITPQHADLLPALVAAVGGAAGLPNLQGLLANIIPIANVVQLPALIAAAGPANLAHLRPLLFTAGANIPDLVFLIPRAGGGNPATLNALTDALGAPPPAPPPPAPPSALTSYNGHTEKLFGIATLAAGNQATFLRILGEARTFAQAAVPPQAGGLHMNRPRPVPMGPAPLGVPHVAPPNARYTIRWGHYFERHVRENFQLNDIKAINAFWPVGWTAANMANVLNGWLDDAAASSRYLGGPTPATDTTAPANHTALVNKPGGGQVNVRGGVFNQPVPPALPSVDQFFPLSNQAAAGITDLTAAELRAIVVAVT